MGKLAARLQTGDLVFFASTRKHLDVFHCGIIVRDDNRILLRHALRSRGAVVEQELDDFLKANRTAGLIIARPNHKIVSRG
jgi:cell wall-associated NlpC family hydrolase